MGATRPRKFVPYVLWKLIRSSARHLLLTMIGNSHRTPILPPEFPILMRRKGKLSQHLSSHDQQHSNYAVVIIIPDPDWDKAGHYY